jgi:hypothetical protein
MYLSMNMVCQKVRKSYFQSQFFTMTRLADFSFTPLIWRPQSPQGCLEKRNHPMRLNLVVWCTTIWLKTKNVQNNFRNDKKNVRKWWFSDTFSKFLALWPNFSAPNYQIQTQWMILLLYTPLGVLGVSK